jgi:hypothetical protein
MAKQAGPAIDAEVQLYLDRLDAAQAVAGAPEDLRVRVRNAILSHTAWYEAEVEHMRVQKETRERDQRQADAERRWKEVPVPKDCVELPLVTLVGARPEHIVAGIKRAKTHWACKDIVAHNGVCRIFVVHDCDVRDCQAVIVALRDGVRIAVAEADKAHAMRIRKGVPEPAPTPQPDTMLVVSE